MSQVNILFAQHLTDEQMKIVTDVGLTMNIKTCSRRETADYIEDADVLVTWGQHNISDLLPKARQLQWIHSFSAGVDELLCPALVDSDIILTNSKGIHGIPIAEHVLAMMLTFTRSLRETFVNQQQQLWQPLCYDEIYDKTLAIIGLGSIGREIAKRAKNMGMNIIAAKRTLTQELFVDKLYTPDQLPHILSLADFVVITTPLTPETHHMFNESSFSMMKKSAYLINVSRGPVVDEAALIDALNNNIISGAALDVFCHEPLTADSPLFNTPNLIITPHIAAMSPYYMTRALKVFAENLTKFYSHSDMINIVNKKTGY